MIENSLENFYYYGCLFNISGIIIAIVILFNIVMIITLTDVYISKFVKFLISTIIIISFTIISTFLYTMFISSVNYNLARDKLIQENVITCRYNDYTIPSMVCENNNVKKK